ncbi:type II secretion system F family protein [Cellulomonas xylanilytica]|uniref:Type II secretion system protein n=1 Tax=Cellulomonas xylanilytica TaxID=233583 RepID=A0A510UZI3_9CELL|nr:type II secretion system F family protein [Cellulomonas xylanilytica]GEK19906.1 type II secretion system protein [Cellulomonas xylanilytica]
MTPVLAALSGALLVAGVLVASLGLQRVEAETVRVRRTRSRRSVDGWWGRWRWPLAAAAGLLGWAVTQWPVAALIVVAAVIGLPYLLGSAKVAARAIDRVEAIEEWTRRLADVLATGVGLEQGILASATTCPPPLTQDVGALVARISARWPTDQALRAFADDLNDAAGDFVVASLLLASRRRGPGLSGVLTAVAGSVADEVAVRRKVEAERARPRSTARLVTLITLVVAGLLMLNGTYLQPYGDGLGQLVLAVIAAAFAGCLLWIRALTLTPPEPRFLTRHDVGTGGAS